MDSSAPSILLPQVQIPSTPTTLSSIYICIVWCRKDDNNPKRGPLKNVVFNSLLLFYFKGQHFSFILLRTKPPSFSSFVFANVHRATADEDDSRTQRFKVEWREYESSDCHLMRNGPGTDPIKIIYRVILLFTGLELSDWWKNLK